MKKGLRKKREPLEQVLQTNLSLKENEKCDNDKGQRSQGHGYGRGRGRVGRGDYNQQNQGERSRPF